MKIMKTIMKIICLSILFSSVCNLLFRLTAGFLNFYLFTKLWNVIAYADTRKYPAAVFIFRCCVIFFLLSISSVIINIADHQVDGATARALNRRSC